MSKDISCRHILVKYTGSRNPHSWRETTITRNEKEAIAKLESMFLIKNLIIN